MTRTPSAWVSAEVYDSTRGGYVDYAWYASYAPANDPKYAVVVMITIAMLLALGSTAFRWLPRSPLLLQADDGAKAVSQKT